MALDLKTDLIAGVMSAADPATRQAAAARLERLAAAGSPAADRTAAPAQVADVRPFDAVVADLARAQGAAEPAQPSRAGTEEARIALHNRSVAKPDVPPALRQFEALALQSFLQSMMPKAAEAWAGGGTAGSMWSSMLTEHMAAAMAGAGGIGLADRLAMAHVAQPSSVKP
ncbi:MAG: rod-binding protein [Hyphomicrobiales bacterium]